MDTVVQVLVKDHAETIVAECPRLITSNDVDSESVHEIRTPFGSVLIPVSLLTTLESFCDVLTLF